MTQTQLVSPTAVLDRATTRMSYVSGTSDTPLLGLTTGDAFDQTVARFPDREALVVRQQGLRYTWAALRAEVDRCARGLLALGVRKGDRVGIWAPNRAEWTITQFATAKIGAILVNINPAYRLYELEYALNQSGCSVLVTAPAFRTTSYLEMLQTLCPELARCAPGQLDAHKIPALRHVISLGDERTPGMWAWGEVLARAKEVSAAALAARQAEQEFDDPINIQYTSVATVGQIHPHVEVKLVDPASGQIVPAGTPGELLTRGYSVMLGYWANDEATRGAIDAARWMHTGDLATMDADGYVNIVGRLKDLVIRGGENVYPREVEEFLYSHPAVSDVQVIGVPDARYGEELMAWVKLKEGQTTTGEELQAFCRGQIATFKIPRYWKFVDAFPMTVTGKVQKYLMRQQAVAELGLESAASARTA